MLAPRTYQSKHTTPSSLSTQDTPTMNTTSSTTNTLKPITDISLQRFTQTSTTITTPITTSRPAGPSTVGTLAPVRTTITPSTHRPIDTLTSILGKCNSKHRSEYRPHTKRITWAQEVTYHDLEDTAHTTSSPPAVLGSPNHHNTALQQPFPTPSHTPLILATTEKIKHAPPNAHPIFNIQEPPSPIAELLQTPTPSDMHTFVPWPSNLIQIIKSILATNLPQPETPEFVFELTREAALKNFCILLRHKMDLGAAIEHQQQSPIGYGSEFRPTNILEPLLYLHPYWSKVKSLLTHGSSWPLREISETSRQQDVEEALAFGNHKQAEMNPELLTSLIVDDVTHGFALPLPLEKIARLPGVLIAPLNIASQDTIDEHGNSIPKKRLTHDQSYCFQGSETSVNSRVDKSKLTPCIFGWAIRRLAHWIVSARLKYPTYRIYATKLDFKSAYRRCHLHATTASQSCAQLPSLQIALLMLRLTFGGTPCPYEWSAISELVCDLATAILTDDEWDPTTTHSPDQHLVPPPKFLPHDIPFGQGRELIIDIEVNDKGTHEMYLDDIIGLGIDIPHSDNILRSERAPLLAMHTCARPIHASEPIPRQDMAARNKLKAEAQLTEIKNILGWTWDLRRLIISLPENKYIAWSADLQHAISTQRIKTTSLESTIGRLTHLSLVVPHVHHFLSRIRELHTQAKRNSHRNIHITQICIDDMKLMQTFLDRARTGIDMNLITYRKPTHVYRSDSCPAGIGGYSHHGFAWRYYLPSILLFRASNNLLEHLAAVITPWIDVIAGRLTKGDCALSMTDSSTSAGWMRKSNFREEDDPLQAAARIEVARSHARRYMNHEIRDYSQWFPGKDNEVADSLSRDMHLSDDELTSHILTNFSSQVPHTFHIVPLPNEIVSWMTSLLLTLPVKPQFAEVHTTTKIGLGDVGYHTAHRSVLQTTSTSPASTNNNKPKSSVPSAMPSEKDDIREALQAPWLLQQSKVPSITWLRPSAVKVDPTQPATATDN